MHTCIKAGFIHICRIELTLLLALAALLQKGYAQHVIDLSGDKWTLKNDLGNVTVPGHVPSEVHLDLYKAKVIDDPYYGLNDFNLRWIPLSNWTYTSNPIEGLLVNAESTYLVFDGLDTFTTIEFCGKFIAATNNQFRQWKFDVSDTLRNYKGNPVLSINFGSAPEIVNAISTEPGQEEWPSGVESVFEFPNSQFMRKEQSDFGWDWGPAFSPAGIWRPAYIVQFTSKDGLYILNTDIDIFRQGQINHLPPNQSSPWVVNASIDFLGELPNDARMSIEIEDANNRTSKITSSIVTDIKVSGNSATGNVIVNARAPKLWWPSGLGNQNLYHVTVKVTDHKDKTLTAVTKRTGFRTIILNRTNITEIQLAQGIAPGANWHFEINGHEFYAKGSNFIPPDAFWPRVSEERMKKLFNAVIAGNQNMLRVWASGAYLPDFIYDIADECGVLLWSEFEFSDNLYPIDQLFIDNVVEEVVYNVRRLNHHPSLALWSGGNELESLMLPIAHSKDPNGYTKYVGEYEKLFISAMLPLVYENSRSVSYSPSSTTNGYLEVNLSAPIPMVERYLNVSPGAYYGDTDFYSYDSEISFNYSTYPVGRFANEFGFHSMPSLQSWEQVVDREDLYFNSSVIMLRNHHYPSGGVSTDNYHNSALGMGEMTMAVERYYPIPSRTDSTANFSAWCHATQIFQADLYKSEIQFYRRGSGMPNRQLGSLYWQLEDIWQAPTWAGIEYDGRWKVLHYVTKDIYQHIIVSPFWNYTTGDLEVYVISDLWESVSGMIGMAWLDYKGKPIANNAGTPRSTHFYVGAINTTSVYSTNIKDLLIPDLDDAILFISLEATAHTPNAPTSSPPITFTHQNHFSPAWMKDTKLVDPKLGLSYDVTSEKFTVEAKGGVSMYTWLVHPAGTVGYFDDNAFVLLPGQPREISFTLQEDQTNGTWVKQVTVQSLWDQARK